MGALRSGALVAVVLDGHSAPLGIALLLFDDLYVGHVAWHHEGYKGHHSVDVGYGLAFGTYVSYGDVFDDGLFRSFSLGLCYICSVMCKKKKYWYTILLLLFAKRLCRNPGVKKIIARRKRSAFFCLFCDVQPKSSFR